ncbi:uncharacterized protein LOC6579160 isoform X14 [Drosophila mojavensis]|uniref:Uncharacterized protein, isoform L n=1 Tax=Drosophila mojavensis TaxID=7230 RepID=A0A0Q9X7R9_DROMO|nr:uncharacterized protein LOC6579160 isoform X14 [Drosophila mojavensis]KRG04399.1 uncharacterized protein Dmoj_GI20257, isoform L [Drosophila mojavensis]
MLDLLSIFSGVFILFLCCAICCCCLRFAVWACYELWQTRTDRQNTVELGRQHSRYGDIFYIEPNSQEAARIQEQLEKDEKDLPSYEEVMRMCNLTTPTAAAAALTQPPMMETSAIGIAALPAPPYSEIDPHRSVAAPPPSIATVTTVNMSEPSPSTSRAAQITT